MAYLDTDRPDRRADTIAIHDTPPFRGLFGRDEQDALRVAAQDGRAGLAPGTWWARLRARLSGPAVPAAPFADGRLEAIRRLGVAARRGGRRAVAHEVDAARSAGLPARKIDAVLLAFGRVAT